MSGNPAARDVLDEYGYALPLGKAPDSRRAQCSTRSMTRAERLLAELLA